jgi:hypothetical protein
MTDQNPGVPAQPAPWLAKADLVAGLAALAFGAWLIVEAKAAAAAAVRTYGRNVDSGAYLAAGAVLFVLPVGALLVLASLALWRRWPWARAAHYFALGWPFAISVILAIAT